MTMVAMSDFPDDVSSQFEPLFNAVGLLDGNGDLDLNSFTLANLESMFQNSDKVAYLLAFVVTRIAAGVRKQRQRLRQQQKHGGDFTRASAV